MIKKNKSKLFTGIILVLISALLMIFDVMTVSFRIILLIIGLAFIATSPFKLFQ